MHSSRMRTGRSLTVCCSLLPGGVPGPRGVSGPRGGVSQHALRQTPSPLVDRHTLVKTLPWPNFVAAGNNFSHVCVCVGDCSGYDLKHLSYEL